ncbi:MAG: HAMP domain-containing sensor histidine kinase [Candidatus Hatepunaea meridiana]|nr:HAMP domain-containing sensor histidine kinase [Candidatus Hatepunaea meridiana]
MRWRFLNWRIIAVAIGVVVLLWTVCFPLKGIHRYERIKLFILEGGPGLARLSNTSQKLFFRSGLITAYRGLYQPLARFVIKNSRENTFLPSSYDFAVSISERAEIYSTFLFDSSGVIGQIGIENFTDQELDTSLMPYIEKWVDGKLSEVISEKFGGYGRLLKLYSPTDSFGGLLLFPSSDGITFGDTAVGMVFNPDWFIERLPAVWDSVQINWLHFRLYSFPENRKNHDFGFGSVSENDTIYWWGDKLMANPDDPYLESIRSETHITMAPQLRHITIFGERKFYNRVIRARDYVKKFFLINLTGIGIIVIVLASLVFIYFRAFKHQRVLMAHYGYIMKMPVSRIGILIESIKDKRFDTPQQEEEIMEQLQVESDNLQRATRTTLAVMKRQSQTALKEDADLCVELRQAAERWRTNVEAKGFTYTVDLPESGWSGRWNVGNMRTALDNLIGNAVKYSSEDEGKNVVVKGYHQDDRITIEVIDNGIGIQKRFRRRVFKPFYIIPDDEHRFRAGIGLGLYQAKCAVKANRGRLNMRPNPDGGSIFRIELTV